ncbi:MAG: hypothetical protein PGN37_12465 [Mycobacterium kyogaense]|uniref:hypothetical protein n=1 Tax=Mycobacterium kyogaense TaxID=2212479 RepID=UPI002FF82418
MPHLEILGQQVESILTASDQHEVTAACGECLRERLPYSELAPVTSARVVRWS